MNSTFVRNCVSQQQDEKQLRYISVTREHFIGHLLLDFIWCVQFRKTFTVTWFLISSVWLNSNWSFFFNFREWQIQGDIKNALLLPNFSISEKWTKVKPGYFPPPLVVILRSATSQLSTQCHFWKKYLSNFLNVWIRTRKRQCPHLRKIYAIYQIWMQLIFSSVFHPYEKYMPFIKFACSLYSLLYFNLFFVHWDKHSSIFSFWSNNYGTLKAFISYNVMHITSKLEWDTTIKTFICN